MSREDHWAYSAPHESGEPIKKMPHRDNREAVSKGERRTKSHRITEACTISPFTTPTLTPSKDQSEINVF